jgi:hypothetical protein
MSTLQCQGKAEPQSRLQGPHATTSFRERHIFQGLSFHVRSACFAYIFRCDVSAVLLFKIQNTGKNNDTKLRRRPAMANFSVNDEQHHAQ